MKEDLEHIEKRLEFLRKKLINENYSSDDTDEYCKLIDLRILLENRSEDENDIDELKTDRKAFYVSELDDSAIEDLKSSSVDEKYNDLNILLDGGSFSDIEENKNYNLKLSGTNLIPDHPDLNENGIPQAVLNLIGQVRLRKDLGLYSITDIAGPIRNYNGNFLGKWALYVKLVHSGIENVFDMESILKDERYIPDNNKIVFNNLTKDLQKLANDYEKNILERMKKNGG